MSAVRNLEALISIENDLKSQYEDKITQFTKQVEALEQDKAKLEGQIVEQLQTITELSKSTAENKRLEQQVRELNNRGDKLQSDVDAQKIKMKTLQKDLAEFKAENKALKQFDADKMKKNLAATKKKLADERNATALINASLAKQKTENTELKRENEELTTKVEKFEADSTDDKKDENADEA